MIARSPAYSIVYSLWLRSRLIILLSLAGTFLPCVIAMGLGPVPRVVVGTGAGISFICGLALLIGVVTYGGADLSTPESVYPKHAMVFPVRTHTLVGAPMLYGTLTVAAFWLVASGAALGLVGFNLPVIWPAGMMAALVAWLQAASWSPYRYPFMRVGVVALILCVLVLIGMTGQSRGIHPVIATSLCAAVGGLAYPVACAGMARARRGDGVGGGRIRKVEPPSSSTAVPPSEFSSGASAQLWFDLVRNLWYPPLITAFIELIFFSVFVARGGQRPKVFLPEWMPPGVLPLCILLAIPVFLVMVHAIVLGKFDMWTKSFEAPQFFLTRPMSTAAMVKVKLRAATVATVLVWGVAGMFVFAFACTPRSYDAGHSWAALAVNHFSWHGLGLGVMGTVVVLLLTWGMITRALWISVSGKLWLIHGFPTAAMLAWAPVGWAGYKLHSDPELWREAVGWSGWVLIAVAVFKVLAGVALMIGLVRKGLIRRSPAALTIALWALACCVLVGGVLAVSAPLRHAITTLIAVVVLFVPLVRPSLAVVLLHYSRHR